MYVREIAGEETSFGVSGALWRDALIFYDRESETYFSQISGQGIAGPHEGAKLREIPSVMTTWGEWKRLHPDTLVLRKDPAVYGGSPYERYFDDPEKLGIRGTENPDDRLDGKRLVLGLAVGKARSAIPLDRLVEERAVAAEVGTVPVVAVAVGPSTGFAYDRRVGGKTLDFRPREDGRLVDTATSSAWDPETGAALEGPMKGKALERVPSQRVYWFVWARFNPETEVVVASAEKGQGP